MKPLRDTNPYLADRRGGRRLLAASVRSSTAIEGVRMKQRDDEQKAEFDDVFVKAETPKAILVEIENEEHWIPQSQVHADSEVWRVNDEGKLVVTRWWAEKEGLI